MATHAKSSLKLHGLDITDRSILASCEPEGTLWSCPDCLSSEPKKKPRKVNTKKPFLKIKYRSNTGTKFLEYGLHWECKFHELEKVSLISQTSDFDMSIKNVSKSLLLNFQSSTYRSLTDHWLIIRTSLVPQKQTEPTWWSQLVAKHLKHTWRAQDFFQWI